MGIVSGIRPDKLAELKKRQKAGLSISYAEILRVSWNSGNDVHNFAFTTFNAPNYANLPASWNPIEPRLKGSGSGDSNAPEVLPFSSTFDINDDTISLEFIDTDLYISNLFERYPEGAKVEVLGYISEIDQELNLWWGLLNAPTNIESGILSASATFGYRSSLGKLPRRPFDGTNCLASFPPKFPNMSLAEIADNDCPYNRHKGGSIGNIDPATNAPYTDCPQNNRTVCLARIGGDEAKLPYLAFDSIYATESVSQSKGAATISTTRGNDGLLNATCPVVFGERLLSDLPVLLYQIQTNRKHPDQGTVSAIFPVSDSHVQSITEPKINDVFVTSSPGTSQNQFLYNLGSRQQAPINLTGTQKARNFSGVAHWRGLIFGSFAGKSASDFRGSCRVVGNDEVQVFTDSVTYTRQYSTNRAWCFRWLLTSKRAGDGESETVYDNGDWIELAARCDDQVGYSDASGNHLTGTRSTLNAQVESSQTQQVIRNIALFGRFTVPFSFEGKKRVFLLKDENLSDAPVFSDGTVDGFEMNIEGGGSGLPSISISKKQLYDLPNRIKINFEDESFDYVKRPLIFSYPELQRARGKVFNDASQQILEREWNAFGVTKFSEAVRLGNMLGDLGEFDSGGVVNNLRVSFSVRALDPECLTLHPYKIIRVKSNWLSPYKETTGEAAEYFRIMSIERGRDLRMKVTAQWYPVGYYSRLEDSSLPPPKPGSTGTGAPSEIAVAG